MSKKVDLIRAWKDPEYRNSLTKGQISELEKNPIGEPLQDMNSIIGGDSTIISRPTQTGCGWIATISGEVNGGSCCNPFYSWGS